MEKERNANSILHPEGKKKQGQKKKKGRTVDVDEENKEPRERRM